MQWYRRGHNGADSKSCRSGGRLTAETVGITGFLEISTLFNGFISTDFLHFFYAFYAVFDHLVSGQSVEKSICSGIEAVITGLTRNQFAGNCTWVRIPPAAPTCVDKMIQVRNAT